MEMRRLQEMGGATLLVSLPKEWTKLASLKKGSVVSLEEASDGGLMIYPVREASDEKEEKGYGDIRRSRHVPGKKLIDIDRPRSVGSPMDLLIDPVGRSRVVNEPNRRFNFVFQVRSLIDRDGGLVFCSFPEAAPDHVGGKKENPSTSNDGNCRGAKGVEQIPDFARKGKCQEERCA